MWLGHAPCLYKCDPSRLAWDACLIVQVSCQYCKGYIVTMGWKGDFVKSLFQKFGALFSLDMILGRQGQKTTPPLPPYNVHRTTHLAPRTPHPVPRALLYTRHKAQGTVCLVLGQIALNRQKCAYYAKNGALYAVLSPLILPTCTRSRLLCAFDAFK